MGHLAHLDLLDPQVHPDPQGRGVSQDLPVLSVSRVQQVSLVLTGRTVILGLRGLKGNRVPQAFKASQDQMVDQVRQDSRVTQGLKVPQGCLVTREYRELKAMQAPQELQERQATKATQGYLAL